MTNIAGTIAVIVCSGCVTFAQAPDAATVLNGMRQALGGDAALNHVEAFSVAGSLGRNVGDRFIVSNLEIVCALPDKCIRATTQTDVPVETTITDGYNGDAPIRILYSHGRQGPKDTAVGPRNEEAVSRQRHAEADRNKQLFARLTIALFGASLTGYPLEMTTGSPDQLDGHAMDVVDLKGAGGFSARLLVDAGTHLPSALLWKAPPLAVMTKTSSTTMLDGEVIASTGPVARKPSSVPPGSVAFSEPPGPGQLASRPPVEHKITFTDFKSSGGLVWPRRIREYADGQLLEDLKLGAFKINPTIDPKRFDSSR